MSNRIGRRLGSLPSTTHVLSMARSLFIDGDGKEAVLLIHGFTGIVGEMEYLGRRLAESGFAVSIPRLPGHGTNHRDFLASGRRDWYRRCVDEYLDLSSRFERVHVAGLSMGGLLTILLAAEFGVPRIALAAPALVASNPFIRLAPLARLILRGVRNPEEEGAPEEDAERRELQEEYKRHHWLGPIAELRGLQRLAASRLSGIESATLTIVSKGDRTVPRRVADIIEGRIDSREKRRVVLERSSHVVVDGVEKEHVADEIVGWFRR